jgi:hypothetical protein
MTVMTIWEGVAVAVASVDEFVDVEDGSRHDVDVDIDSGEERDGYGNENGSGAMAVEIAVVGGSVCILTSSLRSDVNVDVDVDSGGVEGEIVMALSVAVTVSVCVCVCVRVRVRGWMLDPEDMAASAVLERIKCATGRKPSLRCVCGRMEMVTVPIEECWCWCWCWSECRLPCVRPVALARIKIVPLVHVVAGSRMVIFGRIGVRGRAKVDTISSEIIVVVPSKYRGVMVTVGVRPRRWRWTGGMFAREISLEWR